MNKISKITSLTGATFMVLGTFSPVLAESTTTKDESVYVILNADGSVSDVTVSDTLHNEDGFKNYQDTSDLTDVQNLKSDEAVQKTDNGYTWTTDDTNVYYQGKSNSALPLETSISYELDGKQIDPDDLAGKSGHLKMTVSVTNTQKKEYTVNGVTYEVAKPFYTVVGGMFDNDTFKNITINHGMTQDDSSSNIAAAVMMPGLKDSLGQLLTGDLSSLNDYLFDSITIEADVTDFSSPTMMMAASTDLSALKKEMKEDKLEGTDLFSQLDELDAATQKLIDGSKTLYEGADQLKDGANQVNDGVGTLVNGTSTLTDGTSQLAEGGQALVDGANQASAGAAALQAGLGQLVSNNGTLISGANKIAEAVLSSAQTQLREQLKDDLITLTWDNYADVLAKYNHINDDMRAQAKQTIRSAVEAQTGTLDDATFNGILYICAINHCDSAEKIQKVLSDYTASLATASAVAKAQNDAALIGQGDYSKIDSILNLALYESTISTTMNNIKTVTGKPVTNVQAEAVWLATASGEISSDDVTAISHVIASIPSDQKLRGITDSAVQATLQGMRRQPAFSNATIYSGICGVLDTMGIKDVSQQAALVTIAGELHGDAVSISDAIITGARADVATATNVNNMITAGNNPENQSLINGTLDSLALPELQSELAGVTKQLQDVRSFVAGLETYTAGVQSAYTGSTQLVAGLTALTSGADTLNAGIQKVNTGAESLSSGAKTLNDGTQTLSDGATQLSDGAKTLYDGLVQYNEEGISKLTQNSALDNLQTASKLIQDMQDDEPYNSYSGISDGTEGTVKFIYKISSVKKEETTSSSSSEATTSTTEKKSFIDRVVDLFKFGE